MVERRGLGMRGRAALTRVAVLAGVAPALVLASLAVPTVAQASGSPGVPVISPQLSGTTSSTSETITFATSKSGDVLTECRYNDEPLMCDKALKLTAEDLVDGPHTVEAWAANGGQTSYAFIYWTVDTTPPTVSVDTPTGFAGTATVQFNEETQGVSSQSVRLRTQAGEGVATTSSCYAFLNSPTPCGAKNVERVDLTPVDPFVLGERYVAQVNPAGAATVTDIVGNPAPATSKAFRAPTTLGEASPALSWTWRTVPATKAKGGSYLVERRKGASVSWSFTGSTVTWTTVTGPKHGRARVLVDDKEVAVVSNYAARTKFGVERAFSGLGSGQHTLTIEALGRKGAKAGTGTLVAVDAFGDIGTTAQTPAVEARWQRVSHPDAAGGSHAVAELKGQRATVDFRGTAVTWLTATGPVMGQALVLIDGEVVATVDNYAATPSRQVAHTFTGLTDARHTLEIRVLGTQQAASSGAAVVVDGISVD